MARQVAMHLKRMTDESRRADRGRRFSAQVELLGALARSERLHVDDEVWTVVDGLIEADAVLIEVEGLRSTRHAVDELEISEAVWQIGCRFAERLQSACTADDELAVHDPSAAGGLIVAPIPAVGWVGWYRRPVSRSVVWAGQPTSSTKAKTLTPRASFDAWREDVRTKSIHWTSSECELADLVRRGLSVRFAANDDASDAFVRALQQWRSVERVLETSNRALAASTEEVRQLSYVASHDLSNPVRTIRTLLPMLQEELQTLPDPAEQWFRYVSDAADSLHRAQQGLWAFSQITHERRFDRCDLQSIVTRARAACEWDEDTSVEVDPLPQVWGNIDQLEVV
ncbi:MAG: hypothetical protein AAFV29_26750, partial [Myxococcota bacterium]